MGVAAVFSAVSFLAETRLDGEPESFLFKHLVRVGLALGVAYGMSRLDYRRAARYSRWALGLSIALLVAVQLVGVVSHGAQRWIDLGPVRFQPSDFAKVTLVLHMAVLLARKQDYIGDWSSGFAPLLVWAAPTIVLIGMENLSTAAVLAATLGVMFFVGRVRVLHMAAVGLAGVLFAGALLATSPARAQRVDAFLGTHIFSDDAAVHDRQAEGYQADQARIAFAMGGLTGVGPGKSVQRDFLPAPYNDFIFAIIAEELGLVGALLVLGLLVAFGVFGVRAALRAPDRFGLLVGAGVTAWVLAQALVNIGAVVGMLPITGITLPFVSAGGSSLVVLMAATGILLNVARQGRVDAATVAPAARDRQPRAS